MRFPPLFNFTAHDMAIDLGTVNTVVYVRDKGIVLNEPSVVAIETRNGVARVRAIGSDAKLMMGKTPDNVRDDPAAPRRRDRRHRRRRTDDQAFHRQGAWRPRPVARRPEMAICVPSGSTPVERRAIRDAATKAGASKVWLIEEPMAAAIGAGMPVTEPIGAMVVDIGGGTTEVAVLSLRGLAYSTQRAGRRRQARRSDRVLYPAQA